MFPGIPEITRHQSVFDKGDSLLEEIKSFTDCIINDKEPLVSGVEGASALETAEKITQLIRQHLEKVNEEQKNHDHCS